MYHLKFIIDSLRTNRMEFHFPLLISFVFLKQTFPSNSLFFKLGWMKLLYSNPLKFHVFVERRISICNFSSSRIWISYMRNFMDWIGGDFFFDRSELEETCLSQFKRKLYHCFTISINQIQTWHLMLFAQDTFEYNLSYHRFETSISIDLSVLIHLCAW